MLTLMSFGNHKEQVSNLPPSEALQDSCHTMAMCVALICADGMDAQYEMYGQLYDSCITQ